MNIETRFTVVIADDHEVVRSGLRDIVATIEGLDVVAEANSGASALEACRLFSPSLLLLDASMPNGTGNVFHAEVKRWCKGTHILVITGIETAGSLSFWFQSQIDGLVFKSSPTSTIREAVNQILEGRRYFDPNALRIIKDQGSEKQGEKTLTPREMQILALVVEGKTNSQIAEILRISAKTVENHNTHLMAKMEVNSRSQLIVTSIKSGAHKVTPD